ncbi:hypothetical protein DPMN_066203 [Dreissena polymorpha]|uniref:Uncharacterized protein n=1 Tax=Dreissena polymorpha TaxID=45954 RepID=A0A9D3YTK7_DREPO|nr:hypothetical protein DPMN_066203 [Dreissena polymorpha]
MQRKRLEDMDLSGGRLMQSIQLALVKTQRTKLAVIVDEVVIGHHYLPRHMEVVPIIRGRNNQ